MEEEKEKRGIGIKNRTSRKRIKRKISRKRERT